LLSRDELRSLALGGEPLTVDLAERRLELAGCTTDQPPAPSSLDRGEPLQGSPPHPAAAPAGP
jgi:hypothetical protein